MKNLLYCLLLLLPLTLPAQTPDKEMEMSQLITAYYADKSDLDKVYIFKLSAEYFTRFSSLQANWLERLKRIDFNRLNQDGKIDFILLKRNILSDQRDLLQAQAQYQKIIYALPFSDTIFKIQQKRRRGDKLNAMQTASQMNSILDAIKSAKGNIKKQPLENKDLLMIAQRSIKELRGGLKNVFDFYNKYDPEFTWWMKTTYPQTDSALADYSKWLTIQPLVQPEKAMDSSGIIGHPLGKTAIIEQLQFQMIPYSPEDLIHLANEDYAWTLNEMKKVSRQIGFGEDWKKALEKVKENHVRPGDQPQLIAKLEHQAIRFVDSLQLVTIPPLAKEAWRMDMLTPEQMRFASYFLGGPEILVAYPNEDQDFNTKEMILRSGNYGFAYAEVFHELIPGHNLQFFMNQRYKPYRRVFGSPFSTEGWAFYWEMLLWDKGHFKTPEEKIGTLFWRMTRSARIIFSLNYHLGNWTPQQCIDFLVDKVGLERFSAESEVRRSFTGGYGPLYQLAYMVGALQMYALHNELVNNGKMTDKAFNDAFLHEGQLPIEMFRAYLTDQRLSSDFKTHWKFIKELKRP